MNYPNSVGNKIKEERTQQKMTQQELADDVGFTSKASINKMERGTANISYDNLVKIAEALNVSSSFLTGETNSKTRTPLDVAFDRWYKKGWVRFAKLFAGENYSVFNSFFLADVKRKEKLMKMIEVTCSAGISEETFNKAYKEFMKTCSVEKGQI